MFLLLSYTCPSFHREGSVDEFIAEVFFFSCFGNPAHFSSDFGNMLQYITWLQGTKVQEFARLGMRRTCILGRRDSILGYPLPALQELWRLCHGILALLSATPPYSSIIPQGWLPSTKLDLQVVCVCMCGRIVSFLPTPNPNANNGISSLRKIDPLGREEHTPSNL